MVLDSNNLPQADPINQIGTAPQKPSSAETSNSLGLHSSVSYLNPNEIKGPQINFLKRRKDSKESFLFQPNVKRFLVVFLIVSMVGAGSYFLTNLINRNLNKASASEVNQAILDKSFGQSGILSLPENFDLNLIKVKEQDDDSLLNLLEGKNKQDSNQTVALYKTKENGQPDEAFSDKGLLTFDFPQVKGIDLDTDKDFVYALSSVDSCKIEVNDTSCTGVDLLITKNYLIDGKSDPVFGENGALRVNLSENSKLANLSQKADNPLKIKVLSNGEIVVLSDYNYQNSGEFKVGVALAKFDNKGKPVKTFGSNGVFYINPLTLPNFLKTDSIFKPSDLKLKERNNLSIELQVDKNSFVEISLDPDGTMLKNSINNENIYILKPDFESKEFSPIQISSQRIKSGKVIFYGICKPKNTDTKVFCLLVYNSQGILDNSFASETKNILILNFPQSTDLNFEQILDDTISNQFLINLKISKQDSTQNFTEVVLIKENGTLNTNFVEGGKWRRNSNLESKLIDSKGRILISENRNLYRLQKPLFIDPVVNKIEPESGNIDGGLEVTVTGDNFFKNPENPKITSLNQVLLANNKDTRIDNLQQIRDKDGNTFYIGSFRSSLKIDSQTILSEKDFTDTFVAKVSKENKIIWLNLIGGETGDDTPKKIYLDRENNLLILLESNSKLNYFGGIKIPEIGKNNLSLVKYKTSGELAWINNFSSSEKINSLSEILESDQGYIIAGNYKADLNNNLNPLNNPNTTAFVASLTKSNGKLNWVKELPSKAYSKISKITLFGENILTWGEFSENILDQIGFGLQDIFYIKINQQDSAVTTNILGGKGSDNIDDIAFSKTKKIFYLSGTSETEFSSITAFDIDAKPIWRTPGRGKIYLDQEDNLILVGNFEKELEVSNQKVTIPDGSGVFIAKINFEGNLIWLKNFSGSDENSFLDLYINAQNEIYFTGNFTGISKFEDKALTAIGKDSFLVKLSPIGKIAWLKHSGSKGINKFNFLKNNNSEPNLKLILSATENTILDDQKIENADFSQVVLVNLEEKDIQVFLGDVLVPSVSIISPNKMIITTPKSEQGKKDLKIIAYDGSQIIITQTFEYTTGIEIKTEGNKTKPISGKTPVII
jgi:hypothetical protein